jgi:hypothetical protein
MMSLTTCLQNHYEMRDRAYQINLSILRLAIKEGSQVGYAIYPTGLAAEVTVYDRRSDVVSREGNRFTYTARIRGEQLETFLAWVNRHPELISDELCQKTLECI